MAVLLAVVHALMSLGYVAAPASASQATATVTRSWLLPEWHARWRLFAPEPHAGYVEARVRVEGPRGTVTSRWIDLTAQESRTTQGRIFLSHAELNQLPTALPRFRAARDPEQRQRMQRYLSRVLVSRLAGHVPQGRITKVQARVIVPDWTRSPWQPALHGGERMRFVREASQWLEVQAEDQDVKGQS